MFQASMVLYLFRRRDDRSLARLARAGARNQEEVQP